MTDEDSIPLPQTPPNPNDPASIAEDARKKLEQMNKDVDDLTKKKAQLQEDLEKRNTEDELVGLIIEAQRRTPKKVKLVRDLYGLRKNWKIDLIKTAGGLLTSVLTYYFFWLLSQG